MILGQADSVTEDETDSMIVQSVVLVRKNVLQLVMTNVFEELAMDSPIRHGMWRGGK